MAKGLSLHLGLNAVDPAHYQGWGGPLNACEADAEDMQGIAKSRGFDSVILRTKEATRAAVIDRIKSAASSLKSGDIFFFTYSGHGGQMPDLNHDEDDGEDETWCLYNGELVDDELYRLWGKFAAGVRILMLSDSCHSGTVARVMNAALRATGGVEAVLGHPGGGVPLVRAMPADVALRTYRANRELYDEILKGVDRESRGKTKASILLISGCQDNQESLDGTFNGLFTSKVLRVWRDGGFKRNYRAFHKAIVRQMPPQQTPNYYFIGAPNPEFEAQIPFTVG
jgi:hypothetical protein